MDTKKSYRRIFKSTSTMAVASVANVIFGLIRMKFAALLLGPAGVGLIGMLQNLVSLVSTVGGLGVATAGTRVIALENGRGGVDAGFAKLTLVSTAGLLAVLCFFLVLFLGDHPLLLGLLGDGGVDYVVLVAMAVALTILHGANVALLTGMRKVTSVAATSVVSSALSTVLAIPILFYLDGSAVYFFILLAPCLGFVISLYVVHSLVERLRSFSISHFFYGVVELVGKGAPFMLGALVAVFGQLMIRGLVQRELGSEYLGYFQASWTISMIYVGLVLGAMGTEYFPRLTAVISDHRAANELVNQQALFSILLAGPVLVLLMSLSPWLLSLLYSSDFGPASEVLKWQVLGDLFRVASWPVAFVVLAAGHGRTFIFFEAFAYSVFFFSSWVLIPFLGLSAVGVGFFFMYFLYFPLVCVYAIRCIGFRWDLIVLRYFFFTLFSVFIVFLVGECLGDYVSVFLGCILFILGSALSVRKVLSVSGYEGRFVGALNLGARFLRRGGRGE